MMVGVFVVLRDWGFAAEDETTTAVHAAIPPVFNGIIAAPMQSTGNLGPTLAHFGDHAFYLEALFGADGFVVEGRLEVLVISFATLLGGAGANELSNADPVQGALGVD